jgi:general secretion pathway protein J
LEYDGKLLRLTRRYVEDGNKGESIRVVAWSQRVVDNKTSWLRWQSEPLKTRAELQAAWQQAAAWANEGNVADRKREVTVAAIDAWQVFYYRNDTWVSALGNFDVGATAGLNAPTLPDGIRLVLTLASGQAVAGNITRDWVRPTLGGGR